jgi:hypothetical protein
VFDAATGNRVKRIDLGACGTLLTGVSEAGYLVVEPSDDGVPTCYAGNNPVYEGDVGRAVALVDPATGRARTVAPDNLGDAMVSRDGRVLAYTNTDNYAVLVDLPTGTERVRVHAPTAFPVQVGLFRALSPDGALALYGDRPQIVVDTATGKVVHALHAGEGENSDRPSPVAGRSPTPPVAMRCCGHGTLTPAPSCSPCPASPVARCFRPPTGASWWWTSRPAW